MTPQNTDFQAVELNNLLSQLQDDEDGFTSLIEEIAHTSQMPTEADQLEMLRVLSNVYGLEFDRVLHLSKVYFGSQEG